MAIVAASAWLLRPSVRRRAVEYFVAARVSQGLGADRRSQALGAFLFALCLAAFGVVVIASALK
jgi:hypothetical protein